MHHNPLVGLRDEAHHGQRLPRDDDAAAEQHDVLQQRLPVGQVDGVAETAAVGDGVLQPEPHRDGGHHRHQRYGYLRARASVDGKENEHAQAELHGRQNDRHAQRAPVGHHVADVQGRQVVPYLVLGAQRVNGLHEAREDER